MWKIVLVSCLVLALVSSSPVPRDNGKSSEETDGSREFDYDGNTREVTAWANGPFAARSKRDLVTTGTRERSPPGLTDLSRRGQRGTAWANGPLAARSKRDLMTQDFDVVGGLAQDSLSGGVSFATGNRSNC